MPRKVRELEADLRRAGFAMHSGKGSHRVWKKGACAVTVSGHSGDDAHRYQEKDVREKINQATRGI
ncbi:MAG: type II toxin-antitoxin system HicA family toxin [Puniceicoccales bacterium]|jgi:predicted RNA binding protein YcfA (HicA-like mRNA interferase family)|nr:type II toxin-antitoxin system HicA family toxin [Puniceicoccales bacterium]